jgi:hypothetical protein
MKKIFQLLLAVAFTSVSLLSCKKSELQEFIAPNAVNFIGTQVEYSFLGNPSNEYIQEIPVRILGDSTSVERTFSAEAVLDTSTTAQPALYEILGGTVPAGSFTGTLRVRIKNADSLTTKRVSLKVRLIDAQDFKAGNKETIQYTIFWSNQIVIPAWTYYRFFFTSQPSVRAYQLIVQTTGLRTFTVAQFRDLGAAGGEALGRVFGDYVKQWNKDNPNNKLLHDTGPLAGQEIVPLYYSRSKFD